MTHTIQVTTVENTLLWKNLEKRNSADAKFLSANVSKLCQEASDRMKILPTYAPQYTLHDECHLLRTTELMGIILGSEMDRLNVVEMALLILSAFFHDQGMVPSKDEIEILEQNEDFRLFRDNWRVEHPNYGETVTQMNSPYCKEILKTRLANQLAELDAAMFTDFLRETHGHRSAEWVRSSYEKDKRVEIQSVNLATFLARLCESHTLPCEDLIPSKGFHYDEQIGTYTVNMPFLAIVLRLADILDFDRDRTPEVLLKNIHFTSDVSLQEWEKHRSVEGWTISPDLIRFTIRSKHPAYEAAARRYMDWIDKELTASKEVCRMQPRNIKGYKLDLPTHVDRSRIEPLDDAYRSHDLEFSLSRDEVVRLLMTDKLYGKEHLCIRELLQNSLDALRYRKALFSEADTHWEHGIVEYRHYVDADGHEVLECKDNGSGMDDEIIQNHFVKVGRSYYRSPFFERERSRLKASGNDFDPCSKFGIGFMSCFMLGDRITIATRRDYGLGRESGPPLIVEIHGLSGLLIIRKGSDDQDIGTTVFIVCRQKPSLLDSWTDKIKLCSVLKGYALATEFPIVGRCEVQELLETVNIPPTPEKIPTLIEVAQLQKFKSIEQDLSEVSPNLRGFARESFLIDDTGLPCLANSEAEWRGITKGDSKEWNLYILPNERKIDYDYNNWEGVPICTDGILVSGPPGRPSYRKDVRTRLGCRSSSIHSRSPSLIDTRGDLKPEITPGRTPPEHMFPSNLPPGWQRLSDTFREGFGLLWEQLSDCLRRGLDPEIFWKLCVINGITVGWIPYNTLWDVLYISLTKTAKQTNWRLVRELGEFTMCQSGERKFVLHDNDGACIGPDEHLYAWEIQGEGKPNLSWSMNSIVLLMSCLNIRDEQVILTPFPPSDSRIPIAQYAKSSSRIGVDLFLLDYVGDASDAIAVQTPFPTANRNHGLARIYHESRYASEPTNLQTFTRSFVPCIAESLSTRKNTQSLDKTSYWQKRVGHFYFSVKWDQYDTSLQPPYRMWTKDKGWFSFEEKDFARWRDSLVH